MENFSETKKGGRPRLISGAMAGVIDYAVGDSNRSARTSHNTFYLLRTLEVCRLAGQDEPAPAEFRWLNDPDKQGRGVPSCRGYKKTIMAELGRIEDDEALRVAAARVCELKPATREAVQMIRRFRTGALPSGSALDLANAVIKAINDYMNTHAGLTPEDIRDALRTAERNIKE